MGPREEERIENEETKGPKRDTGTRTCEGGWCVEGEDAGLLHENDRRKRRGKLWWLKLHRDRKDASGRVAAGRRVAGLLYGVDKTYI